MRFYLVDVGGGEVGFVDSPFTGRPDEVRCGGQLYAVLTVRLEPDLGYAVAVVRRIRPKGSVSMTDEEREVNEREHLPFVPSRWAGS